MRITLVELALVALLLVAVRTAGPAKLLPPSRTEMVNYAATYVGYPYVMGSDRASRQSFDCSSFTRAAYLDVYGVDIGDTTYTQHPNLPAVEEDDLQTGDLAYWTVPGDEHTGIVFWGDDQWMVLHAANPAQGVRVDTLRSLNESYPLIGYRRPDVR